MTIICVRDGVMAVDSLLTQGSLKGGKIVKWRAIPGHWGGGYAAACGDAGPCASAVDRLVKDGDPGAIPVSVTVVWLQADGSVRHFVDGGAITVDASFHADGSGCEVAIGAMAAGASAEEAANIACQFVSQCGGPVHVLKV